jgi:hypothetical protein
VTNTLAYSSSGVNRTFKSCIILHLELALKNIENEKKML